MGKNKKKVIITMIMIVSIITFFFVSKNIINKKYEKLPEVRLNNKIEKNKAMAIMVTNDNGIGYKEYEENKWPEGYNFKKAECVDNNGNKVEEAISYDESTNKVTMTTNKTVYCTLYFDEDTILNTLRKNDPNGVISTELVGDLYRYQGQDNINNYICYGTHNEGECKDNPEKYMYRIIGVNKLDELKLIKSYPIKENSNENFSWNEKYKATAGEYYCDNNGICPEWPNSLLFKRLNGTINGSTSGSGTIADQADTNIFLKSKEYGYLNELSEWYQKIKTTSWFYGDITTYDPISPYDGDIIYDVESGKNITTRNYFDGTNFGIQKDYKWSNSIEAKIGLMYIHDYYYAYADENGGNAGKPGNFTEAKKSWINLTKTQDKYKNSYEYLMTRYGVESSTLLQYVVWRIGYNTGGDEGVRGALLFRTDEYVRPVFYLENGIELEGNGTERNPYIIPPQKNEQNQIYYDYEYTGDIRKFVAPEDGTYKLELWGAQGGSNYGGKGGYASGYITLTSGQKLYLVVGSQANGINGGYNGGGNADEVQHKGISGGGGATHIAKESGLLKELNNNKQSVLIVAAGGGGGNINRASLSGGYAGGIVGGNGTNDVSPYTEFMGNGATLSENGICPTRTNVNDCGGFGYGGSATGQTYGGAGGGSGYYGGSQSSRGHAGAGGGSGYTGGVTAYNGDQPKNIAGNEIQPSPKGESQTGNSGNGFARITKIL